MQATTRKIFVAGSTGATGTVLVPMAARFGLSCVAHQRPKPGRAPEPNTAVCELSHASALAEAMAGCTTVVQLIGTMKKRFASGDTYESSDIGTTVQLVNAAKVSGVDHVVLLSSVGAGGAGAYLKAKARAEAVVMESGLAWSIFRPSALEGGPHKAPPLMRAFTSLLGLHRYRPISLEQLSAAMLLCAKERSPVSAILEGEPLFSLAEKALRETSHASTR